MKRFNFSTVTILAVTLMFVFASCMKDGVYKPKKKISKIYETVQTDPNPEKKLKEIWTWDGKLLSTIDYGDDDIAHFTYEKKQLKSITLDESRIDLNYDEKGKWIDNFKVYHKDDLEATYTFEHGDKNLISGYTIEYEAGFFDKNSTCLIENVFRFLVPEIAIDEAIEYTEVATSPLKGKEKHTVTLTYDGKNVIERVYKAGDLTYTYTYTYTEYRNPFYGLLETFDLDNSLSKNAPSTCVRNVAGLPDYNYSYTYLVDGKVPTQATENMTWSFTAGITTTTHTETIITDYEYTK